jgi:hypothetical protein
MTLTGTTTLLTKNVQLGDPENEYVREISRLNALKGKITDEQRAERDYLKWRGALYWDDADGPVMPAANVFRSIQQGASITRNGKDVERGLIIHDLQAVLEFPGKRDLASLWAGGKGPHVDRRMARVNRAPVVCVRPAFPIWSATFRFDLDEEVMSLEDFRYVAEKAGRMIHIGDYRRFFGAYSVSIEEGS